MPEIISKFKNEVGCNEAATIAQIKLCNLKLKQAGFPELPDEYAELLMQANGFSNEGVEVFGAEVKDNNWFKDIAAYNLRYFKSHASPWVLLGKDEYFYFIYEKQQNKYAIVEQDSVALEFISDNLQEVLSKFLRIED